MTVKSAYERAADSLAEGARLQQARLASIGQPPADPYETDFYGNGVRRMNGQQNTPPVYKDAYTRACESLAENDRLKQQRLDEKGSPQERERLSADTHVLAARLYDPNKPQPVFAPDPKITDSMRVLAARMLGKPLPPEGSDTDGQE
jgi:hypothetical protein